MTGEKRFSQEELDMEYLKIAIDTRKFEITLFWERTLFFGAEISEKVALNL